MTEKKLKIKFAKDKLGMSLLEVVVALAIFVLVVAALGTMVIGGNNALIQGGEQTEAESLAQEGIEATRLIRDSGWNKLVYNQTGIQIASSTWAFKGEGTSDTIGKYMRTISFQNVCRNGLGNIATCPASYTDLYTKNVVATVTWTTSQGKLNSVYRSEYLTDWGGKYFLQTNWIGGSGQSIWSDATKYSSDDGNLDYSGSVGNIDLKTITSTSSGSIFNSTFTTSTDYTYNASLIEFSSGLAQLKPTYDTTSGSSVAWSTTWGTYADWEDGTRANGTSPTTGGNPTNYKDIQITSNNSALTTSGYWQQSFVTTAANPNIATINFDWSIKAYNGTNLTSYVIYVFVDSAAGAPTLGTQVWSQTITGTTGWASVTNLDVHSKLTTAGTYYIKLVARRIKPTGASGTETVGWDNVNLSWSKSTISYSSSSPSIYPNASFNGSGLANWTDFIETATKNGGEITYQLSTNNGSTWQYYNGSAWAVTGGTSSSTAATIDANISTLATSTGNLLFKAFLISDGTQQVKLDNIRVTSQKKFTYPFDVPSLYAYNTSEIEVTSSVARLASQWSYRKSHLITHSTGAGTNYQKKIIVHYGSGVDSGDNVYLSSHCRTDFGDIRFRASDGVTNLDYWVESQVNGDNAVVWVEVAADLSTVDQTIYIYYGNPGATTASNGKNTFIVFDDFSGASLDTSVWQNLGSSNISQSGGILIASATNLDPIKIIANVGGTGPTSDNLAMRARFKVISGTDVDQRIGLSIKTNTTDGQGYNWVFHDFTAMNNAQFLDDIVAWGPSYSYVWTQNTWYTEEIYHNGTAVRANFNDGSWYSWTRSGRVGYFALNPGSFTETMVSNWDFALVRKMQDTEPANSTWGTETAVNPYSNSNPTIQPTTSLLVPTLINWTSFTENATKNGGEIYYQLSTDDGATWQYWNGSAWATAGGANYNTAAIVNTNIGTFSTSSDKIMFKAFLSGNGSQQVTLNDLTIGWGDNGSSSTSYSTSGYLISSAYNMGTSSPVQIIEWDQDLSSCTACSINFQVRTAPDSSGSPGTWTSWYGASGVGTYFTNNAGTIISSALNGNQWLQYQAVLTGNASSTPILQEVRVDYQ